MSEGVRATRGRPKGTKGTKRSVKNVTPEMISAFESKLDHDPQTGCWIFQGKPTPTGHTTFHFSGEVQGSAHRVAYEIWKGSIPKGGYVLQTCDNKLCCNPDHLYLGTFGDIMKKRDESGKSIRGTRNPKAKLTPAQAAQIRKRSRAGEPQSVLSREFGVSLSTVSQIKNGNLWREDDAVSHPEKRGRQGGKTPLPE